ncbi:MAG: alpha/beta hydrolase [Bacillota bacterium]
MDFKARRIVLPTPGPDQVEIRREIVYKSAGALTLKLDLYRPTAPGPHPAVIFVHGDAPGPVLADAKDWGQYRSWGELTAASGLAAVTFTHRSTERLTRAEEALSDVTDLLAYVRQHAGELGIDPERLGLWVCSAGGPVGLTPVLTGAAGPIRCAAALYPLLEIGPDRVPPGLTLEELRPLSPLSALERAEAPVPPLLLVRAGQDHPNFTQSAERFAAAALARNLELELINYATGHHGFDLVNDEERSRQIIRRVVDFFRERLGA